ncbi:MAG: 50S ribosomal protein L4 [Actinomycetales bacterium]|nr:MAG: 50S ribosomal protein L4 [Actinomycetales bacterium]
MAATKTLKVDLPAEIFDVQVNVPLIHQVVAAQLAAARRGTHATKTRGMVAGGGRKPYRQKGTGRARQGSVRAPQFTGGGTVHGPHPRDYAQRTPKKMKAAALRGALSDRARNGRVHVVESIVSGNTPSTSSAATVLGGLTDRTKFLVVLERGDQVGLLSVRNLASAHVLVVDQLNTYDVLCADDIVFTKAAFEAFTGGATQAAKTDDTAGPGADQQPSQAEPAEASDSAAADKAAAAADDAAGTAGDEEETK